MRTLPNAFVSGANANIRNINVLIKNVNNETMYTSSDIVSVSVQRSVTDGSFGIGFTQSDRLCLQVVSETKIPRKTWLKLYISFDNSPAELFGWFASDECVRDGPVINVTAYDAMYYQSKKKVKFKAVPGRELSALSFPCAMQDMLDYICALRTFTCDFQCQNFTVGKLPQKDDGSYYTVRELIGFIAASHGCNAKIDAAGHLQFKSFEDVSYTAASSDVIDMTIDDSEPFEVTGVLFTVDSDTTIYIDDVPGSDYDEDDPGVISCFNPLASVEIAEYVWTQVGGLLYYGGSLTQRGKGIIEAGDVITVGNLKYPVDTATYSFCVTTVDYSITSSDGFIEVLGSEVTKGSEQMSSGVSSYGAGSGTGVFLDNAHTSVAHNDVEHNTSAGVYDSVDGYKNTLTGTGSVSAYDSVSNGANTVTGQKNTLNSSTAMSVSGSRNTVNSSHSSVVTGYGNTVNNGAYCSFVGGQSNTTGQNVYCSLIEGSGNNIGYASDSFVNGDNMITGGINKSVVIGNGSTIGYASTSFIVVDDRCNISWIASSVVSGADLTFTGQANNFSAVFGKGHTIDSIYCSLVSGFEHDVTGNYDVVGGQHNTVTSYSCGVFGDNHTANSPSAIYCGTGAIGQTGGNNKYIVVGGGSKNNPQNIFTVDSAGNVQAAGSYGTMGADYAEYFEWADGNPDNEDRRGILVMLYGDKIVPANGDDILGVISGSASVIGNAYELYWCGKYAKNVYGSIITTPSGEPLISPDYDPSREYIPRSQRPEWSPVGLVGRLIVCDNGKCEINGYISARNGIAVKTTERTGIRMLRRVDDTHIEVLIK